MLAVALAVALAPQDPTPTAIQVALTARAPSAAEKLRWSPKAATVPLTKDGDVLRGELVLGPAGAKPVRVELTRSAGAAHVDRLALDADRDGAFAEGERLSAEPKEQRGKWWSSFTATVQVPFVATAPGGGADARGAVVPYPLDLWLVVDPREPDAPLALRWSRRGWHAGEFALGNQRYHVLITEMALDGVFTDADAWQLGTDAAAMLAAVNRSLATHAWVDGRAFRVTSVAPDGSRLVIEPFDPGVTEAEERERADRLKADREAKRAAAPLTFAKDLPAALAAAKRDGKRVLVDFVTTWCGPCKEMDRLVWTAADVVAAADGVIAVKLDGDEQRELAKKYEVKGYPTLLLLDADSTVVRRATGYQGVQAMVQFLAK